MSTLKELITLNNSLRSDERNKLSLFIEELSEITPRGEFVYCVGEYEEQDVYIVLGEKDLCFENTCDNTYSSPDSYFLQKHITDWLVKDILERKQTIIDSLKDQVTKSNKDYLGK